MKRDPLVSVIINNYNYERFLPQAIDSALAQRYPSIEVVVVDDGSTDASREIIAGYGDRVVRVLKRNGGQASALNAGFAASRGTIVIFLDADDYLFPQTVARVVAAWEPGVAEVQYRLRQVDARGNAIGFLPALHTPMDSGDVKRVLLTRACYVTPPTSGRSFDRAVLERILPIPEDDWRIATDGYLEHSVPFYGRISSIEEPLGAYRVHGSNRFALDSRISVKKLQLYVQYALLKQALLTRKADEFGHEAPADLGLRDAWNVGARVALLRLSPETYPVPYDRPWTLTRKGLRATWYYSDFTNKRKLAYTAWFLCAGLLPLTVAKAAINWLFAPGSRPRSIRWAHEITYGRGRPASTTPTPVNDVG